MQIYLPIAEISIDVFLLFLMGGGVGFLSGIFGVGGGFLMTPLLIFIGIPPAVAVATQSNNIIASSVSGVLAHMQRGNVDFLMGGILTLGGFLGSFLGVLLFKLLRELGQIDLVINLSYVILLGTLGILMSVEGIRAVTKQSRPGGPRKKLHEHHWFHGLPLRMRFRKSRLYISALLPFGIGAMIGVLSAIMGVGGGFVLVPAMIYVLGMPTAVVIGTSLFQVIFVAINITILQSIETQTVDVVLAMILLLGSVIGAQIGTRAGAGLRAEWLRLLLGLLVLSVCIKLFLDLLIPPADIYSLEVLG
ncbi:sulfite exporter TauE/SafE family protein [Kiloniella sp. b19]|uniref:sulfite exporter TauE/SafE family protein n=1 Tax=Kiloniella sp. GXU_MW_B19 TaxID=3141326 RepID=UPI0031D7E0D8